IQVHDRIAEDVPDRNAKRGQVAGIERQIRDSDPLSELVLFRRIENLRLDEDRVVVAPDLRELYRWVERIARNDTGKEILEGRARVAEVVDLKRKAANRSARRQAGVIDSTGADSRMLLDRQCRDDAAFRRADQVDLLRGALLGREDVDQIQKV